MPGSELALLMLAMLILIAQYLLIFFLVLPLRPLLRRLAKLLLRPLRQGLFTHQKWPGARGCLPTQAPR